MKARTAVLSNGYTLQAVKKLPRSGNGQSAMDNGHTADLSTYGGICVGLGMSSTTCPWLNFANIQSFFSLYTLQRLGYLHLQQKCYKSADTEREFWKP